jgi:microsomal epoxide hydrolase
LLLSVTFETGSFLEFLPILSMFSEEYSLSDLPFHIVVPSLPGYGYSSGPPIEKDFTVHDIPRIIDLLMKGLGFGSGYIAQGGDVGSGVARSLSKDYESCKGQ